MRLFVIPLCRSYCLSTQPSGQPSSRRNFVGTPSYTGSLADLSVEAFVCRFTVSFFAFAGVVFLTVFFALRGDVTEEGVGEDDFFRGDGATDFLLLTDRLGLRVLTVLDTVGGGPLSKSLAYTGILIARGIPRSRGGD